MISVERILATAGAAAAIAMPLIAQAAFLTADQKRDIFYNNAARFLKLTQKEIAAHHGR